MIEFWKCVLFINFIIWVNGQQTSLGASPNYSGNSGMIPLNCLLNQFSNRNNPAPQYNQFANQQNTLDILSRLLNSNNNGPQVTAAFSKPCPHQNNVNNIVSKLLNTKSATELNQPTPQVVNNYIIVPTDFLNNNITAGNIQTGKSEIAEIKNKSNQGDKSERKRRNKGRKSRKESTTQNENLTQKRKRNKHDNVNQSVKVKNNGPYIQQQIHSDNPFIANNIKVNDQNPNLENGQIFNTQPKMTNAFIGYVPREYYPTLPQNNINSNCLPNNLKQDYNHMLAQSYPQSYVDLEKSDRSYHTINDVKSNIASQISELPTQISKQVDTSVNENGLGNNDENIQEKPSNIDDNLKSKRRQEAVIKHFQQMFPGVPETVVKKLMAHLKRQLENGNLIKNNNDVQKFNENVHSSEQYNMPRRYESTYGMSYPMHYFNNNNCRCRPQSQYVQPSYRVVTQRCPNRSNPVRKANNSKPNKKNLLPKELNKSNIADEKLKLKEKENSNTDELNDQKAVPLDSIVTNVSTETNQNSNKPIIEKEIITFRVPPTLESPNFLTRKVDVPIENKYPEYNHPVYNTNNEESYTKDLYLDITKTENNMTKKQDKEGPKLETSYAHSKVIKYSPSTSTNNNESNDEENLIESYDFNGSHKFTSDNATIVVAESMPYSEN